MSGTILRIVDKNVEDRQLFLSQLNTERQLQYKVRCSTESWRWSYRHKFIKEATLEIISVLDFSIETKLTGDDRDVDK